MSGGAGYVLSRYAAHPAAMRPSGKLILRKSITLVCQVLEYFEAGGGDEQCQVVVCQEQENSGGKHRQALCHVQKHGGYAPYFYGSILLQSI